MTIDVDRMLVQADGRSVELTPTEFEVVLPIETTPPADLRPGPTGP